MSHDNPTVKLGDKVYKLPPLNGGQVRKNWPALVECIQALDGGTTIDKLSNFGEMVEQMTLIVHLALSNENPNLSRDEVDKLLIPDLQEALGGVIAASGLGGKSKGEVKAPAKKR